jgi:hypothetical protein
MNEFMSFLRTDLFGGLPELVYEKARLKLWSRRSSAISNLRSRDTSNFQERLIDFIGK